MNLAETDWIIWIINGAIITGLLLIIYVPAISSFAQTAYLDVFQIVGAVLLSLVFTGWWEIVKWGRQSAKTP